ncbi:MULTISPECIES: sensor histidine kinase [unclassified Streptomyces]|uniref:sensor histidine kinase n=1 Tax=unclassified Streptomyces TaxID=2593676 RepID=UPI002259848B|nr:MULTISPECIES: sensor histidine kinase [unclassified Streptomyces]WSP53663.1 sensor histidine kinase [Streptomyces sp. NBC_01241]WSU25671.1 sensor histidine kinase [Streptomyces sp. NBC_01108]MCX4785057.1 sensor histidine kinase [Streptomyces sp. NBC_01221]MCX4799003.1 sensor histidine kinase [Streptomyces sp. NBC_01242]WSJ40196.1 sensor histidine kinase [Streptomyces sp. NBC_01321]
MEEQRSHWGHGGPPRWLTGEPGYSASRLPWPSTILLGAVVMIGSTIAARGQMGERAPLDLFARLLLFLAVAVLLLRHRHPVVAVFGASAAAMVYLAAGYPYGPVFLAVAVGCFSAVVAGHRRAAWSAVGMVWLGHVLVAHWLYRWLPPAGGHAAPWGQELGIAAWVVAIVAAAEFVRVRREQWADQRAEREAAQQRRADEERLRMARELHDVLAHSISVINVQSSVGLALLDSDPEQARTALTTIKAASKEALGEVRQVLDTLRTPGDAPRAPAPGLDRLPELVEQAASTGLTVTVETDGVRGSVPPGADLAAFRIVQEALTNVVRHSGSRTAQVRIGYEPGRIRLRIDDEGPATGNEAGGSGNGLAGMRERAAALGGTIEAGSRADGGFRVRAELPLLSDSPGAAAPKEETP